MWYFGVSDSILHFAIVWNDTFWEVDIRSVIYILQTGWMSMMVLFHIWNSIHWSNVVFYDNFIIFTIGILTSHHTYYTILYTRWNDEIMKKYDFFHYGSMSILLWNEHSPDVWMVMECEYFGTGYSYIINDTILIWDTRYHDTDTNQRKGHDSVTTYTEYYSME